MNKSILLGSALAVALSAPAMAADSHALEGPSRETPCRHFADTVLATTEGGATCNVSDTVGATGAGAAYCGFVIGASGELLSDTSGSRHTVDGEHPECHRTVKRKP